MINVIIPAYNAHSTIERAISSVVSQTALDKISLIIVNDGSKKDYNYITKKYEKYIKIKNINNLKNLGVGATRQIGLDSIDQPYFCFLDADDYYINDNIFKKVLDTFEKNKKIIIVSTNFIEENKLKQKTVMNSIKGFHGKFYRTDFIKEKNIQVPNTVLQEDTLFNRTIMLCSNNDIKKVFTLNENSYFWRYNSNSLTSKLTESSISQFEYIKAIEFLSKNKNIQKKLLEEFYKDAFFVLYVEFNKNFKEQFLNKKLIKEIQRYYLEYINPQNFIFTENIINEKIQNKLKEEFIEIKINFLDFLKLIEGESND